MNDDARELILQLHREEVERIRKEGPAPTEQPTGRVEELPEGDPDSPTAAEWALFRRELAWLLSQGNKGRIAVVKAGHPITTWDTVRDALQAGGLLYGKEMFLIQEIQPYLAPVRLGRVWSCRG
jgi:hypothetical protein